MNGHAVDTAIILAAGMGTRLRGEKQPLPKPLVMVGGLTLLKRTILNSARRAGVKRFVVVVGCEGDRVQASLANDPDVADLELIFVHNDEYKLANGVSVLKARPHVRGECLLMMCDHVVDPAILRLLQDTPARGGLVLAVDRKLGTIFDMDDATKVRVGPDESIAAIDKQLTDFDAVDTGVFRIAPALFDALQAVRDERGDASLSEGVKALAEQGRAKVADVGEAWWQDVDEANTRVHAETLLFRSLTKPADGPVSRHLNRRFSKTLTRMVMNLPVVPNHMTAVGLLVGLAAAVATALTTPQTLWMLAVGGLLFQLSSAIDGCDGEIARLKFKHSDWGEWFDTISDDVVNLSWFLAAGYALFNVTGSSLWLQLGAATFVLGWVLALSIYRHLMMSGKGTHLAIEWAGGEQLSENPSLWQKIAARLEPIAHRDVYALIIMFVALAGVTAIKVAVVLSVVQVVAVSAQWYGIQAREARTAEARREPVRQRG